MPNIKLYDGSKDPKEHVAHYRERMEIIPIPIDLKEACLYKGFRSTLTVQSCDMSKNIHILRDILDTFIGIFMEKR